MPYHLVRLRPAEPQQLLEPRQRGGVAVEVVGAAGHLVRRLDGNGGVRVEGSQLAVELCGTEVLGGKGGGRGRSRRGWRAVGRERRREFASMCAVMSSA